MMHPCCDVVLRLFVPCRTYEDVEHAMRPGGRLARGGETSMSTAQAAALLLCCLEIPKKAQTHQNSPKLIVTPP